MSQRRRLYSGEPFGLLGCSLCQDKVLSGDKMCLLSHQSTEACEQAPEGDLSRNYTLVSFLCSTVRHSVSRNWSDRDIGITSSYRKEAGSKAENYFSSLLQVINGRSGNTMPNFLMGRKFE